MGQPGGVAVSGYLALAAATVGDREAARQYATAARDTATRWGWHAYVDWLDEARDQPRLLKVRACHE